MLHFYTHLAFVCTLTFRKRNILNAPSVFRDLYQDSCSRTEAKESREKMV